MQERPSGEPVDPGPEPGKTTVPDDREVADSICQDILAIQTDSYGGGAEHVHAHIVDDTVIVILDDIELLPNEEFMLGQGRADAVARLREDFQRAIEPTFRAAVERAIGRRVIGFASHVQLEELRFSIEIFRLEPAG